MQPRIPGIFEIRWPRRSGALGFGLAAAVAVACGQQPQSAPAAAPANEIPKSVSVAGGQLVSGTARGLLRANSTVSAFTISQYPTTVAEYRECVAAGACSEPASRHAECIAPGPRTYLDRATYDLKGGESLPVTCALLEQARSYCQWVGGDLPTMAQWELAVRGNQPAEFAWGATPASCNLHPAVGETATTSPCARQPSLLIPNHSVGAHHSGASPFGVEDVLLTRGELLVASGDAQFSACQPPMNGCVASGVVPGGIDGFTPIVSHSAESEAGTSGITAGFRCVWSNLK